MTFHRLKHLILSTFFFQNMSLSYYAGIVTTPSNPHQNVNQPGLSAYHTELTSTTTPQVLWSAVVPRGKAISVRGIGTAIKSDHADGIGVSFFTTAVNNDSNSAQVINSTYETISSATVTLTFTIITTEDNVNMLVCTLTAAPSGTYSWRFSYQLQTSP